MKRSILFLVLVVFAAVALVPQAQAAQNTANTTADANATVITAIGISRTAHMNFGSVVAGGTAGTVLLTPSATPTRTSGGGTTLGSATVVSAATFTVTGEPSNTYMIDIPQVPLTIMNADLDEMTVEDFSSSPTPTGTLDGTGNETLYVGGTLHVHANQATGVYNGTFTVTVTYN
jgi:hypothetical protein